jgi:hypothetical protein
MRQKNHPDRCTGRSRGRSTTEIPRADRRSLAYRSIGVHHGAPVRNIQKTPIQHTRRVGYDGRRTIRRLLSAPAPVTATTAMPAGVCEPAATGITRKRRAAAAAAGNDNGRPAAARRSCRGMTGT